MERIIHVRYIVMDVLKCERKRAFLETIRFKYRKNSYYKTIMKKLLYTVEEIILIGKQGIRIELPFTSAEIEELPRSYVEQYIQKILEVYGFTECYLCEKLKLLRGTFGKEKKWLFSYLLFEKGISSFLRDCHIEKRNARFVLIDSGDRKAEMILESLLGFANYLTIVTSRMEHFGNAVEVVYEETGLMMDLASSYSEIHRSGNVVINLNRENYRLYSQMEENSYVVDLEFTEAKHGYIESRRKKFTVLYDYDILVGGQELDKELVAEIIGLNNWKVGRFLNGLETNVSTEELGNIVREYEIEIKEMKMLKS